MLNKNKLLYTYKHRKIVMILDNLSLDNIVSIIKKR